jgi:hypothetical protein
VHAKGLVKVCRIGRDLDKMFKAGDIVHYKGDIRRYKYDMPGACIVVGVNSSIGMADLNEVLSNRSLGWKPLSLLTNLLPLPDVRLTRSVMKRKTLRDGNESEPKTKRLVEWDARCATDKQDIVLGLKAKYPDGKGVPYKELCEELGVSRSFLYNHLHDKRKLERVGVSLN